jgi:hypothetical protein
MSLVKCIVMPLNEEVIAFAEQDERGKDYRDLRIRGLKGEDVRWTLFDYEKCARDGVNYWACQIDKMAKNLLSAGIDVETIAKASGLSIDEINDLEKDS